MVIKVRKILAIFICTFLGCSTSTHTFDSQTITSEFIVREVLLIDGNMIEHVSLSEQCQDAIRKSGSYFPRPKECARYGWEKEPDTTKLTMDNVDGNSILKDTNNVLYVNPRILLSENDEMYITFCNEKFHTYLKFDSNSVASQFDSLEVVWGVPYQLSLSDSLITLKGLRNNVSYVFRGKIRPHQKSEVGRDVSRYLRKPFADIRDTVCESKFIVF